MFAMGVLGSFGWGQWGVQEGAQGTVFAKLEPLSQSLCIPFPLCCASHRVQESSVPFRGWYTIWLTRCPGLLLWKGTLSTSCPLHVLPSYTTCCIVHSILYSGCWHGYTPIGVWCNSCWCMHLTVPLSTISWSRAIVPGMVLMILQHF